MNFRVEFLAGLNCTLPPYNVKHKLLGERRNQMRQNAAQPFVEIPGDLQVRILPATSHGNKHCAAKLLTSDSNFGSYSIRCT